MLQHLGLVLNLLSLIWKLLGILRAAKISETRPARSEGRRFTYFWVALEAPRLGLGGSWAALGATAAPCGTSLLHSGLVPFWVSWAPFGGSWASFGWPK